MRDEIRDSKRKREWGEEGSRNSILAAYYVSYTSECDGFLLITWSPKLQRSIVEREGKGSNGRKNVPTKKREEDQEEEGKGGKKGTIDSRHTNTRE